jgi:hypothetical protein
MLLYIDVLHLLALGVEIAEETGMVEEIVVEWILD